MVQKINKYHLPKETVPGARMHTDFWGPYPIKSIVGGCKWFVSLIDEATDYSAITPIASKKEIKLFIL